MKFLVQIAVDLPEAISEEERSRLIQAERKRGRELVDAGAIFAIWRVPGERLRNVGIWEARDEAQLRELLASLPLHPWMTAEVTRLTEHPLKHPPGD